MTALCTDLVCRIFHKEYSGLVVTEGGSCSKDRGFESQHGIPHGHFFTHNCCKNCIDVYLKRPKIKEAGGGPFFAHSLDKRPDLLLCCRTMRPYPRSPTFRPIRSPSFVLCITRSWRWRGTASRSRRKSSSLVDTFTKCQKISRNFSPR